MTLGPSHEGSGWNWPWLSQLLGLKVPAQEAERDHSPGAARCPQRSSFGLSGSFGMWYFKQLF